MSDNEPALTDIEVKIIKMQRFPVRDTENGNLYFFHQDVGAAAKSTLTEMNDAIDKIRVWQMEREKLMAELQSDMNATGDRIGSLANLDEEWRASDGVDEKESSLDDYRYRQEKESLFSNLKGTDTTFNTEELDSKVIKPNGFSNNYNDYE
jgi:hypothetical protein